METIDTQITLPKIGGLLVDLFKKFSGSDGNTWLHAFKKFLRKEDPWTPNASAITAMLKKSYSDYTKFIRSGGEIALTKINRYQPFDLASFVGENKAYNIIEEDEKALELEEIDLSGVLLMRASISPGTKYNRVSGEEHIKKLKELGYIRLDAAVFKTLWADEMLIPETWKEGRIYFDGTLIRGPFNQIYVITLYWSESFNYRPWWSFLKKTPRPTWCSELVRLDHPWRGPSALTPVIVS